MTGRERVQVFVTETGVPKILDGWLTSVEDTTYTVELPEGVDVAGQVVLNFPDSDRIKPFIGGGASYLNSIYHAQTTESH